MTSTNNNGSEPVFLYVEDDLFSCEVAHILLTSVLGYSQVQVFEDSSNFASRLEALSPRPDVIFLDIQMGPINGYRMLQIIRQNPIFKDTPVVAMTANVMAHDVDDLRSAGFNALIGKPILKEVFPQLVEQILNGESVWYVP